MKYRHEWKHEITYQDMLILRNRLLHVAKSDAHAINNTYFIRSLYFDNIYDKALHEKIDGINKREKFRIRYYNHDTSVINLEKKSKINGLCLKEKACLSKDEVHAILLGKYDFMMQRNDALIQEFYTKVHGQGLRPKTIVDYTREPFVYTPGNVRITLDYNIRTSSRCNDFLSPDCITIPAGDSHIILEIKWDEFLPQIIKDVVQLPHCQAQAFSKYATCRIYG